MEWKRSDEHTFRRKDLVITLAQSHLSRSTERKPRLIHRSSSKDLSLLHRPQMNWSRRLSIDYAATRQLCSIPLSYSEKHTIQPLLMASGFFLALMFKPMSQIKTVDMSWTGGTHSRNPVMNLECICTLYKVRTRLDRTKGGVNICGRTPQA